MSEKHQKNPHHGPDCHCDEPPWESFAAAAIVQDAMKAHLAGPEEKQEILRTAMTRFADQASDLGVDLNEATTHLVLLLGGMIAKMIDIAVEDGEEGAVTQAVLFDSTTGEVIDDPDVEADTAEKVAGLAASRIVAALNDDDGERAFNVLAALPDSRTAVATIYVLAEWAGRASLEDFEQAGLLPDDVQEQLNRQRESETATRAEPLVRTSATTGRSFVRLPDSALSEQDVKEIKERSRGPAVYGMAILGPEEDANKVALSAHAEMVETALYDGYLCEHLHFASITLADMPEAARRHAAREIRRRERMEGKESNIILCWRHTRDCGGQDVISDDPPDLAAG